MDFKTLPMGTFTLQNVTVPGCFLGSTDELVVTDIGIANGTIAKAPITRERVPGTEPVENRAGATTEAIDMAGAMVLPAFVDMHTHLDKGHILPRAPNPDGTFMGALNSVRDDHANWSADDVYRRADFSLRCAYAHGTRAVRTHLDSPPAQDKISWPVFSQLRAQWAGKIDLQAVSLNGCDSVDLNGRFLRTAELVKEHGGVLGLVAYPMDELDSILHRFFELAATMDLEVDFHVDETMDPSVECVRNVCRAIIETGFSRRVTLGHLCSISVQNESRAKDTLDLMAEAQVHVVSLPMCNLYLQDRHHSQTPRRRGVTLVHEMKQRGISVSFASDNTRDPFYVYGDMDMIEVMREATRLAHLDHAAPDWVKSFSEIPASTCNFTPATLRVGASADLVICNARNYTELYARPQSDRIVMRDGIAIDRTLPGYEELDDLFQ